MAQQLTMSKKERDRLAVLARLAKDELTHEDAAIALGIGQRQLYRLKARNAADGNAGLVHRLRGRSSNRRVDASMKQQAVMLYRERYSDYGPTLFSEMLREHHQITLAAETLRQWLLGEGLWERQQRRRRHRKKRARRTAIGELVQFDGSIHDWFEGRGPCCTLLVAIDDASGRVFMHFAKSENTEDVMATLKLYCEHHGIPRALYTDGGSVYYSESGKPTDFALALDDLNIEMIRARSPQAKGRVERSNRTQQDRLIKAMRRAGVSSINEANAFLEQTYLTEHNARFATTDELADVHRSCEGIDLERIFASRCKRTVNNDWTVRLNSQYLQLLPSSAALPPPGSKVDLRRFLDGSTHVYWQSQELAVTLFKEKPAGTERLARPPKPEHPWNRHGTLGSKRSSTSARERMRQRNGTGSSG